MLTDLLGYFKRNSRKMSAFEKKKALNEINQIQRLLENELKVKGAV